VKLASINKRFTIGKQNIKIEAVNTPIVYEARDNGQKKINMRHCWKPPGCRARIWVNGYERKGFAVNI